MKHVRKLVPSFLALALALLAIPTFAAEGVEVVNINTATAEQLALLPRVGPAVAARILEFREENGKFETAEDLMLVRGIGERTFELIEPFVSISGETTLVDKVRASSLKARDTSAEDSQ